jgi:hypothetical protein
MTLNKFVFKTHKWLAVGTLLASVFWWISGIVIVTPNRVLGNRPYWERSRPDDAALRDATVTVAQAIGVVDAAAGSSPKINQVQLRILGGRAVYEITTSGAGVFLVDAMNGSRFTIDEAFATRMVKRHAGEDAKIREATLLRQHGDGYDYGTLPAWRVTLDDARDTRFFVTAERGEVTFNDRGGRIRHWLASFHTFAFLNAWFSDNVVKGTMWVFSVFGTVMLIFGCWILWLQWRIWLAGRRMRAAQ